MGWRKLRSRHSHDAILLCVNFLLAAALASPSHALLLWLYLPIPCCCGFTSPCMAALAPPSHASQPCHQAFLSVSLFPSSLSTPLLLLWPQRIAWAQDQWQQLVQVSKGEAGPSFDPQQEASDALQRLLGADVVLTSYEVLRQEVHYSPESAGMRSLRRAKKYVVPESPLLNVRFVSLYQSQPC